MNTRKSAYIFLGFILPIILLWSVPTYSATTIRVPADQPTIQAGIDAAADGDTVLVADGTYTGEGNTGLDFKTRRITLRSQNGPDACIIDGESVARGLAFQGGEDENSVLSGFTITNCVALGGGAIYCYNSSPTITNCIIKQNKPDPALPGCGGGIYCYNSSPIIKGCVLKENISGQGGGICFKGASSATVTSCIISGNTSATDGGGIYCDNSSITITNCIFFKNVARFGGGIGFVNSTENATIINTTITSNIVDYDGGGVYSDASAPTFANCIIWGNARNEFRIVDDDYFFPVVTYSDVEDGYSGEGNIDTDPQFVEETNYRLKPASACIDSGTSSGAPNTDIAGTPRPQGFGYDMGAYEYEPPCPDCSGAEVTLTNKTFPPNKTCECIGSLSIEITNFRLGFCTTI